LADKLNQAGPHRSGDAGTADAASYGRGSIAGFVAEVEARVDGAGHKSNVRNISRAIRRSAARLERGFGKDCARSAATRPSKTADQIVPHGFGNGANVVVIGVVIRNEFGAADASDVRVGRHLADISTSASTASDFTSRLGDTRRACIARGDEDGLPLGSGLHEHWIESSGEEGGIDVAIFETNADSSAGVSSYCLLYRVLQRKGLGADIDYNRCARRHRVRPLNIDQRFRRC
jgi:hypothetical protein